jgi:hypothetical protein
VPFTGRARDVESPSGLVPEDGDIGLGAAQKKRGDAE